MQVQYMYTYSHVLIMYVHRLHALKKAKTTNHNPYMVGGFRNSAVVAINDTKMYSMCVCVHVYVFHSDT